MESSSFKKWINIIAKVDRRVVYVFILLAIVLPFFLKPVISIRTTKWVERAYALVEEAAELKKPILLGFDFDPATMAELQPMIDAILRHAFSRDVKVLGLTFLPNAVSLAATSLDKIGKEYNKVEGVDYVFLPYLPQLNIVLINFGDDLRKSYTTDFRNVPIKDIPMLKNIKNYDDFHVVIDISGTKIPQYYILYGVNKFNFKYIAGVTAVSATEYFPYLQSGQMKGLLPGMKAAAEYESLIGHISDAMRGMASQTWGHLTIIFFIIFGNIIFYLKKRVDSQ